MPTWVVGAPRRPLVPLTCHRLQPSRAAPRPRPMVGLHPLSPCPCLPPKHCRHRGQLPATAQGEVHPLTHLFFPLPKHCSFQGLHLAPAQGEKHPPNPCPLPSLQHCSRQGLLPAPAQAGLHLLGGGLERELHAGEGGLLGLQGATITCFGGCTLLPLIRLDLPADHRGSTKSPAAAWQLNNRVFLAVVPLCCRRCRRSARPGSWRGAWALISSQSCLVCVWMAEWVDGWLDGWVGGRVGGEGGTHPQQLPSAGSCLTACLSRLATLPICRVHHGTADRQPAGRHQHGLYEGGLAWSGRGLRGVLVCVCIGVGVVVAPPGSCS